VQRQVYDDVIAKKIRAGQALNFAHGYNIHFGLIVPPKDVDVILVAPRMIGTMVRESYEQGGGSPAFVAVHQDATGHALESALAYARGIGATRAGVLRTTFRQETELHLFQEQGLWPLLVRTMITAFEFLVEQGFPPEMVALQMYGSAVQFRQFETLLGYDRSEPWIMRTQQRQSGAPFVALFWG